MKLYFAINNNTEKDNVVKYLRTEAITTLQ